MPFFLEQLSVWEQPSEDECPAARKPIKDWVRHALEFGRRTKADHPQRIAEIVAEIGGEEMEEVTELVNSVVAQAGGTEPRALAGAILKWHKSTNERPEPPNYGRRLERVIFCADFAIWVPWAA